MSSLRRVSSLTSGLLTKPGIVPSNIGSGAVTSASAHFSQFQNGDQKKDSYQFVEGKSNTAAINNGTVKCKESNAANEPSPATSGAVSPGVRKFEYSESASVPICMPTRVCKRLPWHPLLSFLKPNLIFQALRYKSDDACGIDKSDNARGIDKSDNVCGFDNCGKADKCDKSDDCKPRSVSLDLPLSCVKTGKEKPPCKIPKQKVWCCCSKSMCLPCCCPVRKPLKCKKFDVRLNVCPRKTYRIAAYSECSKRYGRKQYIKECCYAKRICYSRNMADREIKPLLHIRDRQALVLGFGIKATCDSKS